MLQDVRAKSERQQRQQIMEIANRARTSEGWALCITHDWQDDTIVRVLGGHLTAELRDRMIAQLQAARVYSKDEVQL